MTTIFKVSDQESITPAFAHVERELIATSAVAHTLPESLDDTGLVDEMDRVEKCASSGDNYAYNPSWTDEQISQLREYAVVCGMKGKMLPARQAAEVQPVSDDTEMQKLSVAISASRPTASAELSVAVGDPFKLSDLNDAPASADKWEKVTFEHKLASAPDVNARSGSIMSIRGEYDYETSQTLRTRRGENSVADPDAIGKLATEQDSGERLRAENAQIASERKAAKTSWQQDVIQAAKATGAGALPRGHVMLAADMAPQHQTSDVDLKLAMSEIAGMTDGKAKNDLPDTTEGERLKAANSSRKTGIQRAAVTEDWQRVKGTTKPTLSDEFADALERQLSVAGITLGGKA